MKHLITLFLGLLLTLSLWGQVGRVKALKETSSNLFFDANRPILRTPSVGVNVGADSIKQWLEWWYFTPPTWSLNLSPSTSLYEIGTSNEITISGTISNSGGATLSNGHLHQTSPTLDTLDNVSSGTSVSEAITFTPQQGGSGNYNTSSHTFRLDQSWVFGGESGVANSTSRSVSGVYPVLYGMNAADLSASPGTTLYTTLTKLVASEGDKTLTLSGTNEFIYYAIPTSWGDTNLSGIIDPNSFNILGGFTSTTVSVSSTGLVNNWTIDYLVYKINNLTTVDPAANFIFLQ